jgi:hypothetical protein
MKKVIIFSLSLTVIFSSCNFSGRLTKRYKSITVTNDNNAIKNKIDVNAYVIEKEKGESPKPKTIFDLSPKAQAALISELSKKETATDKFISGLTNNLSSKPSNTTEIIDYSQFEKRIVVSIRNKSHMPADRISKINITLDIGNEVKILSCNKLTTEYQTLDLGKLNYSNTQNAEVTGNASIEAGNEATITGDKTSEKATGKMGVGVAGKLSANRSFSEEVLLKQRMVALNAAISQNKLSLYQEGISGIDLTGNILADVTLGIENLKVEKIYSFSELIKNDVVTDAGNIKASEKIIICPNLTQDIKAKISFEADYREVLKKHKTISESDDKVNLYYGTVVNTTEEVIIPQNKIKPKLWKLTFTDIALKLPIQIKSPAVVVSGDLLFNSFNEAKEFALWLKSKYDDSKTSLTVTSSKYVVTMPTGFTTIQNIEILPHE